MRTGPSAPQLSSHSHRTRHHRPWYKRLWRWFFPRVTFRPYHLAAAVGIILLSFVLAWNVAQWILKYLLFLGP